MRDGHKTHDKDPGDDARIPETPWRWSEDPVWGLPRVAIPPPRRPNARPAPQRAPATPTPPAPRRAPATPTPPARTRSLAEFLRDMNLESEAQAMIDLGVPDDAAALADLSLEEMVDFATQVLQMSTWQLWLGA